METETASFTRMDEGSYEDYQLLMRHYPRLTDGLADAVLAQLKMLAGDKLGYKIDRFEHSLQTATRAFRDSADEETVVCALLHDIGDILAPENHSQLGATILRPYVSPDNYWVIKNHGAFQAYYYFHHIGLDRHLRDEFRGHPMYERTAGFCEKWDQVSFDPAYENMPLEAFEPMVRRVFARTPFATK
jgi:predicted HD phosphohydrolase